MRTIALGFALLVAGCGIAQRAELAQRQRDAHSHARAIVADCEARYPQGQSATAVARIRCFNGALAVLQPTMRNPDLLAQYMAYRLQVAEQIQAGKITIAQGNVLITQKWSAVVAEDQQRSAVARSVAAQETAANADNTAANVQLMALGLSMMNGGR